VGDSEEFAALRDYRPGDPLRRIHWKSWAKTGKPVVREFQEEFFVRHALVLDTFQEKTYSHAFEEAVSVAASFAYTVKTQDSLLDLIFVGARAYCFTSGRGISHVEKTMEILSSVAPCTDKPFGVLAGEVLSRVSLFSGCICVLLDWDQQRQDFIQSLKALHVPLLVIVIQDSDEKQGVPRDLGPMKSDPDHFIVLDAGNVEEQLARWGAHVKRHP